MELIRWILWIIVACLALSFAHGNRVCVRRGAPIMNATIVQTFFLWVIAIVFLLTNLEKLHLLWLVPLAYFFGQGIGVGGIPILSPIVLGLSHMFGAINLIGVQPPEQGRQ